MPPIELLRTDALELMLREGERSLAPTEFASYAFSQLASWWPRLWASYMLWKTLRTRGSL